MNESYVPPFELTNKIVKYVSRIAELSERLVIRNDLISNPRLRKNNRIKTIHASLAIENNSLTIEQVTDVIDGNRILGPEKDIIEVKNAFDTYEKISEFDFSSVDDFLLAHKYLLRDLGIANGCYRSSGVGVYKGNKVVHMAPPANMVPKLVNDLFLWIKNDQETHDLIKSCVFHYEVEFIHPFADGNGRMGRLWQTVILHSWKNIFGYIPIETLVREKQEECYDVLGYCDKEGSSTKFIEYMLSNILEALNEIDKNEQVTAQVTAQVKKLIEVVSESPMSANELMELVGIKHKQSFRQNYLVPAVELGLIAMTHPDKPRSSKQKYYKIKDVK